MKSVNYLLIFVFVTVTVIHADAQQPNTTMQPGITISNTIPSPADTKDVYLRENIIQEKKPIPYQYIREADVLWAKDIWRFIDLRQRMNYPLRFPEAPEPIGDRYSLLQLLLEGIRTEEITPYSADDYNNPWQQPISLQQVYDNMGDAAQQIEDPNQPGVIRTIRIESSYLKGYRIKEKWVFDKQNSEMKVRITVIGPVLHLPQRAGGQVIGTETVVPFYIYFPQCRNLFATHRIYNPNNDAQNISFDDLFMQRRFATTIIGESNEFGNRFIVDYVIGQDALLEAERIKNDLFIMEHDFWEY
ncbi:MAG: gliding motility protein GldN [Bacteroidales bacterium]|nr:gliding motility protein GldN [Bacteroidales bacterium]